MNIEQIYTEIENTSAAPTLGGLRIRELLLARETGVDKVCRTLSAWSHTVSLLYAQLTHSIGLNDVCDALRLRSGPLWAIRGATPPSRNGLSHAGKERKA